jgi:hypothetical protein
VYPNTLRGQHLKIPGLALSGLMLVRPGGRERVTVPAADLSVQRHTNYQLMFHFPSRFTPPAWLTPGTELSLRLEFRRERDGSSVDSDFLQTVWLVTDKN